MGAFSFILDFLIRIDYLYSMIKTFHERTITVVVQGDDKCNAYFSAMGKIHKEAKKPGFKKLLTPEELEVVEEITGQEYIDVNINSEQYQTT